MIRALKANEIVTCTAVKGRHFQIMGGDLETEVADIRDINTWEITENVGWSTLTYTGETVPRNIIDGTRPITSVRYNPGDNKYVCASCGAEIERMHTRGKKEIYSELWWNGEDGLMEDIEQDPLHNNDYEGHVLYECSYCQAPLHDIDRERIASAILEENDGYVNPSPVMDDAKIGDVLLHRDLTKSTLVDVMDIGDEAKIVGYKTSRMHHVHNVICEVNGMWLANPPLKSCNDVIAVL